MKIGVDIDDVLLKCADSLIKYHNDTYDTKFKIDQFKSYGLYKTWGGTQKDDVKKINDFFKTDYFINIDPFPHSQEAIKCLAKNNNLIIITARPESIKKETEFSIEKYFPNCFEELYFTKAYLNDDKKAKTKKEVCDLLGIDILVEDSLEHSLNCVKSGRKVFLMNRPWNKCDNLPQNIIRINSWKEVAKFF